MSFFILLDYLSSQTIWALLSCRNSIFGSLGLNERLYSLVVAELNLDSVSTSTFGELVILSFLLLALVSQCVLTIKAYQKCIYISVNVFSFSKKALKHRTELSNMH